MLKASTPSEHDEAQERMGLCLPWVFVEVGKGDLYDRLTDRPFNQRMRRSSG